MNEPCHWTLLEMRAALDRGDIEPGELLTSCQRQISRWQPLTNAYTQVFDPPLSLPDASGPLAGIPVSIKDSLDIAGHATVCGHAPRLTHRAAHHALAVRRLLNQGAVILGKTNTPEVLMNWETHNDVYGFTRNPWDLTRTPGGSSGGESAAIASCMSAGGIGSDGGGSIRLPAALTGICGLKPTPGRIPATGHFPAVGHPGGLLGVIGPMARTIADLRILFHAVAGHDDSDPFSVPFVALQADAPKVFGILDHPHTRLALPHLPGPVEVLPAQPWDRIFEVWRFFFLRLNAHPIGFLTPHTAADLAAAPPTAQEILHNLAARDALRSRFLKMMDRFAVLILPVADCTAWPLGEFPGVPAMAHLTVANLLGLPSLALPVGLDAPGLPIGIQLIAKPWQEELLLSIGETLEKARGPFPSPVQFS